MTIVSLLFKKLRKMIRCYGFTADPRKTIKHNAYEYLKKMPTWYYFTKPSNIAFHDLTQDSKNKNHIKSLLGLNLKFIPTPFFADTNLADTEEKLLRSMKLQAYFAGDTKKDITKSDLKTYTKSPWTPNDYMIPPDVISRGTQFLENTKQLFKKRRGRSNLLPTQKRALDYLQKQSEYIVCTCDKNLGPALIERKRYISEVLTHLSDTNTYERLDPSSKDIVTSRIKKKVEDWLGKHMKHLTPMERKYMCQMSEEEKKFIAIFLHDNKDT